MHVDDLKRLEPSILGVGVVPGATKPVGIKPRLLPPINFISLGNPCRCEKVSSIGMPLDGLMDYSRPSYRLLWQGR
ncbi:MAG: hypothetical protein C5B49_01270 [Bdellovibrio sp.]|nr:MAG: hypothetical protein C5B49_01270 [Bdellovibrio sp.]